MFTHFYYTLKAKGLDVSLGEWLTLIEALHRNLADSNLTTFYHMAKAILVKRETDFDKFDMAFEEEFKGIMSEDSVRSRMLEWLNKEDMNDLFHESDKAWLSNMEEMHIDKEDVETKFKQRLKDQDSEHNGGSYWIGTMLSLIHI